MKLWIIGKRGMLARALQRICREKNVDYLATSRKEVDITDSENLKRQFDTLQITHVVNCSGYTEVDLAEKEVEKAKALNVNAVETLGHLARAKGVKLIHFSTDYVFDGRGQTPYAEEATATPLSIYGQTKRTGEEKLLAVCPHACIIRTSWLFGREGGFIPMMTNLMKQNESLHVISDQRGSPTFCDDLARATIDLLDHRGIYHFANAGEATKLECAREILKYLRAKSGEVKCQTIIPVSRKAYGMAAKRPDFSVLKTEKYAKATQKTPRLWRECLREYFEVETF